MTAWKSLFPVSAGALMLITAGPAFADCAALPNWQTLQSALRSAVAEETSGLNFDAWATVVDSGGTVCAVAFSGQTYLDQWLGSRVISAQKANTANAFSLHSLSLATANLYSAVQPGGSLYGLQHSNPVEPEVAYGNGNGNGSGGSGQPSVQPEVFGTPRDPMVGQRIGGVNVFGGGLALYGPGGVRVGGVGTSGDTSCADHMVVWRLRHALNLDYLAGVVPGVSGDPQRPDNIVYDIKPNPNGGTGISAGGFGHPTCINTGDQTKLPPVR